MTDSYGYTPYGRMVAHEGPSDQPFTYVGEYGVRQEFGTGVYQMGARYYDVHTAQFLSQGSDLVELDRQSEGVESLSVCGPEPYAT